MSLQIDGLTAGYGGRLALHEVSASVAPGEVLAIIGPNGCGKSTLLRCLAGLLEPTAGTLRWNGSPVPEPGRERARLMALLPQNSTAGLDLRVEEMTLLGRTPHLGPYGAAGPADLAAMDAAIALAAPDLRGRKLLDLSGGERQRALLCRPLATGAPILLLDEPIAALDLYYQHQILTLVRKLATEQSLTVICVLHQINLAAAVSDQMLLLNAGRAVACGTPDQVMTAEHLSNVYRTPLRLVRHPLTGRPQAQSMFAF